MGDAAQKEPSMEDILSSIRKIVSQDEKGPGPNAGPANSAQLAGQRLASMKDGDPDTGEAGQAAPGGSLASLAEQIRSQSSLSDAAAMPEREEQELPEEAEYTEPPEVQDKPMDDVSPDPAAASLRQDEEVMAKAEPIARETNDAGPDKEAFSFREALIEPNIQQSVSNSFEKMKKTILENIDERMDALMRPMLAEWLNENLPGIVERIVREEVERLARTD